MENVVGNGKTKKLVDAAEAKNGYNISNLPESEKRVKIVKRVFFFTLMVITIAISIVCFFQKHRFINAVSEFKERAIIEHNPEYGVALREIQSVWDYTTQMQTDDGYCHNSPIACIPPLDVLALETKHGVKVHYMVDEKKHVRKSDLVIGLAKMLDIVLDVDHSAQDLVMRHGIQKSLKSRVSGLKMLKSNWDASDFEVEIDGTILRLQRRLETYVPSKQNMAAVLDSKYILKMYLAFSTNADSQNSIKNTWYLTEHGFWAHNRPPFKYTENDVATILRDVLKGLKDLHRLGVCKNYYNGYVNRIEYYSIPNKEMTKIIGAKIGTYANGVERHDIKLEECIRRQMISVLDDLNKFMSITSTGTGKRRRVRGKEMEDVEIVTCVGNVMVNFYYMALKAVYDGKICIMDTISKLLNHKLLTGSYFGGLSDKDLYSETPLN